MELPSFTRVLANISYKPDHFLDFWPETPDGEFYNICWTYMRPDSRTKQIEQGQSGTVLVKVADMDEESLVRTVFGMTLRLEEHEAREFLIYDGKRPFDPHKSLLW